MWYEQLNNNVFIMSLYDTVPELKDVEIEKFIIDYYDNGIKLVINIPYRADNIPIKWKQNKYNAVTIEIDFWVISSFCLSADERRKSVITIEPVDCNKIQIVISGGINTHFVAEYGYIQKVSGYIMSDGCR